MSIIDRIQDKFDDIVIDVFDKVGESIDLMDRRMKRRFEKLESKEDNFNAFFGLENFKVASFKERFNAVFSEKEKTVKTKAEYGDIIGVDRGLYQHYGIYIGNDRVIHYIGQNKDFDIRNFKDAIIQEDDISRFLKGSKEYFVFDCETKDKHRLTIYPTSANALLIASLANIFEGRELLEAYSPEETVERAKSKKGENKYNLATNNCEHFAIWCKTGIYKSTQVDSILNVLTKIPIKL